MNKNILFLISLLSFGAMSETVSLPNKDYIYKNNNSSIGNEEYIKKYIRDRLPLEGTNYIFEKKRGSRPNEYYFSGSVDLGYAVRDRQQWINF